MTEAIVFDDINEIIIPVKIAGEDYTLHEATGDAECKHRNAFVGCMKELVDGKPKGIGNIADVEPLLISLCLRDANSRLVPESKIRSWPHRVTKTLYDKIRKISDMEEGVETVETLEAKLEEARKKEETVKNE